LIYTFFITYYAASPNARSIISDEPFQNDVNFLWPPLTKAMRWIRPGADIRVLTFVFLSFGDAFLHQLSRALLKLDL
jgi:hypothetical protein